MARNSLHYKGAIAASVLALAVMSGCAESSLPDATGKGMIRGINALVDSPELTFKIEEVNIGTTAFRAVAGFAEYDDLTYTFNFDVFLPGEPELTRVASQFVDVVADTEYTLVLTGTYDNPSVVVWENAEREFAETDTVFEVEFLHHAPSQGSVDIYFQAPGNPPVLGSAVGTIANNERIPLAEFAGGEYQVIVTAQGDPASVLYTSENLASVGGTRISIAIFDPDPASTSLIAVNLINAENFSAPVADLNSVSRLRLVHADITSGNIDGYLDSDFGNAAFADIAYRGASDYADIDQNVVTTTLTTAGNVGNVIVETNISISSNTRSTGILGRDADGNALIKQLADNARPVAAFPVYRFTNMSVNASPLDIYVLDAGTTISDDDIPAFVNFPLTGDTSFVPAALGAIEITATARGETTPVSNVLQLDTANGDVFDIAIFDTADPNVVEFAIIASQIASP